jgi:hypothetical protein
MHLDPQVGEGSTLASQSPVFLDIPSTQSRSLSPQGFYFAFKQLKLAAPAATRIALIGKPEPGRQPGPQDTVVGVILLKLLTGVVNFD